MSSDVQSAMELLQMNDYASLVMITLVTYDYVLSFSKEVDYVWNRTWTWVSMMFVLVRYIGLSWAIFNGLWGSIFLSGSVKMYASKFWLSIALITIS
ncbi:hypothetical protein OG21DRAFT_1485100 [Imleria badia]|nr:hypothetical protein OG21DRAFT_1485100 [Imleria badia]